MIDYVAVALCIVAFAWWVTMHLVVTASLAQRTPRWRALVGLFVVPLAPYWAWHEKMRKRVWCWGAGLAVYLVALGLASRH